MEEVTSDGPWHNAAMLNRRPSQTHSQKLVYKMKIMVVQLITLYLSMEGYFIIQEFIKIGGDLEILFPFLQKLFIQKLNKVTK